MKYKIFVSGVQKELEKERYAVKELISDDYLLSEYFSVFLFEDLPAKSKPAEKVYIDEVRESDIYVGIFGNEYGRTDESGLSATEKEYNEAKNSDDKDILIFIKGKDSSRAKKLTKFLSRIKDGKKGHCYERFNDIREFKKTLYTSLIDFLKCEGIVSENSFGESICKGATLEDIDEKKVKWFLIIAREKRNFPLDINTPVKDLLIHLKLLGDKDKPTNAAILLFGKEPHKFILQAEVKCIQFPGTEVEKPFSSYQIYISNIFEQIDRAVSFVLDSIKYPVIQQKETAQVKREHEIPVFAIQEAIVNAVTHRNYNTTATVQVMVFVDRVEIWNPGRLTKSLTIEKLKQPHSSFPTNPLVAYPVYLANYIQRAGSGTVEMTKQCRKKGLPEPEFVSSHHEFKAILARDIYTKANLAKMDLSKRQKKIIEITKQENYIQLSMIKKEFEEVTDKTLYRDIQGLVKNGILRKEGKKKGRKYFLK